MNRYSIINQKQKREIVLLRGSGCIYRLCTFCDYHADSCPDTTANFELNSSVLANVTGLYGDLEVINSGSVFELDNRTLELIKQICRDKGIKTLHFEAHWLYRDRIEQLRKDFSDFDLKMKLGLETYDHELRENVLHKGINCTSPAEIARGFDEVNLLFGLSGQTAESMTYDVETALRYFERVCINVMCRNSTAVLPDPAVIAVFKREILPRYRDDRRVDILVQNTDFGVGD